MRSAQARVTVRASPDECSDQPEGRRGERLEDYPCVVVTAMEIGKPRRTYEVEPLEDPVPRALPEEAPEPERSTEAPGEPEQVPSPAL